MKRFVLFFHIVLSFVLLMHFSSTTNKVLAQGTCECDGWCTYDLSNDPNCNAGYEARCFIPDNEFDPCDCECLPIPDTDCECLPGSECTPTDSCGVGYVEYCGPDNICTNSQECSCVAANTVATPPPLPTTNWRLLYRTVQPTPSLFTFSNTLTVGGVISPMLGIIFPIAGLILLLMIIYGGYNWMLSAGDPKKAARAKEIITVALIGFIIIFTSYWLVQIIGSILGLGTIGIIF